MEATEARCRRRVANLQKKIQELQLENQALSDTHNLVTEKQVDHNNSQLNIVQLFCMWMLMVIGVVSLNTIHYRQPFAINQTFVTNSSISDLL